MNPPPDIAGQRLRLHGFGPATVRKLCMLDKKELVCDVKTDGGELLHLSIAYCEKLMRGPEPVERQVMTRGPM